MRLRIGLSYAPDRVPYPRYVEAVRRAAARLRVDVEVIDLWGDRDAARDVDAIVLTGGEDVAPERYGKGDERGRCGSPCPDRDEHEFALVEVSRERALPLLGICRGAQLLNVAYGGTLITDIDTAPAHTKQRGVDARHDVNVMPGASLIRALAGSERAGVNSSHHQAVDVLAEPFVVTARSAGDGLVEAFEWREPAGNAFLLAVQWHPERMDESEPLAGPIFERLLACFAPHLRRVAARNPTACARRSLASS